MRLAARFNEWDVEGFKAKVDADQWARWQQFEALEPSGWRGLQAVAGHLAYWILKAAAPKANVRYDQMKPEFRLAAAADPVKERMKWKAWAEATQTIFRKVRHGQNHQQPVGSARSDRRPARERV